MIESYCCSTKYELVAREQFFIDNNDCVNRNKAYTGLSKKEYLIKYQKEHTDEIKEYKKQYTIKNIIKLKKQWQEHYKENHDKIQEQVKQYRIKHADEIKERYVQNILKNSELINCPCGSNVVKYKLNDHLKTLKHQNWINSQKPQE